VVRSKQKGRWKRPTRVKKFKQALMKKRTLVLCIAASLVCLALVNIFFPRKNIVQQIDDLRIKISVKMDSFNNKQQRRYGYFEHIEKLIDSNKLNEADSIVNNALKDNPADEQFLTYKGQIFEAQKKYDSALYEYNNALLRDKYSSALVKRAELFAKQDKYDNSIIDYKTITNYNTYYAKQLAIIYDLKKQKDSSLKYYNIYLKDYPNDSSNVLLRIKSLSK